MVNLTTNKLKSFGIILLISFVLSSCGARKKTTVLHGKGSSPSGKVYSDASSARGVAVKGNTLASYAEILGVSERSLNNKKLYNFIDEWIGSPHRLGGLEKNGIDCSAFVGILYSKVYQENLPRTSRDMAEHVKRKYENQLKEGDLVFFSFGGRNIDHVGVYLQNNKFVHVSTKRGVIISDIKDTWYYKYFTRAGTPKG